MIGSGVTLVSEKWRTKFDAEGVEKDGNRRGTISDFLPRDALLQSAVLLSPCRLSVRLSVCDVGGS